MLFAYRPSLAALSKPAELYQPAEPVLPSLPRFEYADGGRTAAESGIDARGQTVTGGCTNDQHL